MAFGGRKVARALAVALALGAGDALAATATTTASLEKEGYARLALAFDALPKHDVTLANGVLTLSFAEPVKIDTGPIVRGLGDLVGMVRRDPDGTAVKIALTRAARLNVTEAGEALYVDLLPANWVGMPPGLPKGVIAALSQAAREAKAAKAEMDRRRRADLPPVTVFAATLPTLYRLTFDVEPGATVEMVREGDRVKLTFGEPYPFDVAAARASLPTDFVGLEATVGPRALVVTLPAPEDKDARGFREDDDYVLDIDREKKANGAEAASPDAPRVLPALAPAPKAEHGAPAPAVSLSAPAPAVTPAQAPAPRVDHGAPGAASAAVAGQTVRLTFPFAKAPAAAVFLRGRTLWALFDDAAPMALDRLAKDSGGLIAAADQAPLDGGRLVRLTLREPRLVTAAIDGDAWVVALGDDLLAPTEPIRFASAFGRSGRGLVTARVDGLGVARRIKDPDAGDELVVVTASRAPRGALRPQSFVEFTLLPTAQGAVVAPIADDIRVSVEMDELRVERDGGLAVSRDSGAPLSASAAPVSGLILGEAAAEAASGSYYPRERELLHAAAMGPEDDRPAARVELARFYLLRAMPAEAKAVLDMAADENAVAARNPDIALLRGAAAVELGRPDIARPLLSLPALAQSAEAALWRAAMERLDGRDEAAGAALAQGQPALGGLPPELRARFVQLAVELALDAGDAAGAAAAYDQLETLPPARSLAAREVLRGRVLASLGDVNGALAAYAAAGRSADPQAVAESELRAVTLAAAEHRIGGDDAVRRLESLVTGWRGDWIEAEGLEKLAGFYADAERWRDAFATLRTAVEAFPDGARIRDLQDRMQSRFTALFLGPAIDRMPKLEALSLFYDFQDLTPPGRRGDEVVRRLADKLVDVELLDQAAALLEYQIDNRLKGAARAQVGARAALVELMNNKPGEAARLLQKTRQADLPRSLASARLVLEARALAQSGRVDLGVEIAEGVEGQEGARLKADILWSARRWGEAGEALEAALGGAWRDPAPLDAAARADVLRAAIALSLADDAMGLDRIRQKFAAKMADSPDARSFEVVTAPVEAKGDAFREIARSIASTAAIEGFLKEYRRRGEEDAQQPAAQQQGGKPLERSADGAAPARAG